MGRPPVDSEKTKETKRVSVDETPEEQARTAALEALLTTTTGHAAAYRFARDLALELLTAYVAGEEIVRRKPNGQEITVMFMGVKTPVNTA